MGRNNGNSIIPYALDNSCTGGLTCKFDLSSTFMIEADLFNKK